MTDWQTVQGSQVDEPTEFDTTSSKKYVYQRRNVELIKTDESELWQYDERKMSFDEYYVLMLQKQREQDRADIEYISAMVDVPLEVE